MTTMKEVKIWRLELNKLNIGISDNSLDEFLKRGYDIKNIKKTINQAYCSITDPMCILDFISSQIENEEEEEEYCTICNNRLESHIYGNVCGRHIPSYALW